MHLLILGATGRTGTYGYRYAIEQNHHVTALVRDATKLEPNASLTIVEGSAISQEDVERAFGAAKIPIDAVISFLNPRRTSDLPWARFIGPPHLLVDSLKALTGVLRLQAQTSTSKPRLVIMSALGVGDSRRVTPLVLRFIIDHTNLSKTYEDHEAVNASIENLCGDQISWTLPLPVGLGKDGAKKVKTFACTERGANFIISRESCARWMVDVAAGSFGDEFSNKRVIVCN